MNIKFRNAVIIWSILAASLVGKDIVIGNTHHFENNTTKTSDKRGYPFSINVRPIDAKIMIMNIAPKYKKGMILPKGKYDIKVSKHGYKSARIWVEHADDSPHNIRLQEGE